MKKIATCFLIAVVFIACNNETDNPEVITKKEKGGKSKSSVADSYTADTLYQNLPGILNDLSASEDMESILAQNWVNADDIDALRGDDNGAIEFPVRSFSMSPDKSVVKNVRNYMETGTWKYDAENKTITFKYEGAGQDVYKIKALAADELRLTNIGINTSTILVFVSDGKRHNNAATDPFHIKNLQWRIAPKKSETDDAIKQRVKNYLDFFRLYYKDAIARRAEVVSFYGFPGCIKWYAGGIYLQKDKDILENWYALFYNKAQGEKGYQIISKLLEKKYTWPKGNQNWIKKNLFVLEQVYAAL